MISLKDLLALWGFAEHPFEAYTAEKEPRLGQYFVTPPYLDDMLGSAKSPTPAVVFGSRGIGKSAIRIHIEELCRKGGSEGILNGSPIAITYDEFSIALESGLGSVDLSKHLQVLLTKMVAAALARIADRVPESNPDRDAIAKVFPELDLAQFSRFVHRYYASLDETQREGVLRGVYDYFSRMKGIVDRISWFRRLWTTLRVPLIDIVNILQSARGKDLVTPVALDIQTETGRGSPDNSLADFRTFAALAPALGFDCWYILIDKVDEDERTLIDATKAAQLTAPLLKNLHVLETPYVGFKFFLWDRLRPILTEQSVRLDKLKNWEMSWRTDELKEMIDRRLRTYSGEKVNSLTEIVESTLVPNVYDLVLAMATSAPRELVQILDAVFREHARHSTQDTGAMISQDSLERGLDDYAVRRAKDLYPEDAIRPLAALPTSTFTSADICTTFRISKPAASIKINGWIDDGYVERVDDIRSKKDPSRLVHQYSISEPRIRRIVERDLWRAGR